MKWINHFLSSVQKTIKHLKTPKKWPSLSQLRYVGRFLSVAEKRALQIAGGILIIGIIGLGFSASTRFFEQMPKQGGLYKEAVVGAPQFINPLYAAANEVDTDIARLLFSGLMRYDESGNLVTDLASSHEVSDDKKTYTFTLRENLFWHDGEPLSTADILFTYQSIQDPTYASPLRVSFQGVTVSSPEENTVTFVLEKPFAPFLGSLTAGIVPQHIWANIEPRNARLSPYNSKPVGNGPFMFSELVRTDAGLVQHLALERFDKFHRGAPHLDGVQFSFYPAYDLAVQDLRSKRVDGLHFVPKKYKSDLERKHIALHTLQLPQYTGLFFNAKQHEALKDARLRQALDLIVDKKKILTDVLDGQGAIINSPILEGFLGYEERFHENGSDFDKANELITNAGWKEISPQEYAELRDKQLRAELEDLAEEEEPTEDTAEESNDEQPEDPFAEQIEQQLKAEMPETQSLYRAKGDIPLQITITTVNDQELSSVAAEVATMWQELGVQVSIHTANPRDVNAEVLRPRQYDVLLYGEIIGADPDPFPFWHSSQTDYPGLNLANFINRAADGLLEQARESTDDNVRAQKYIAFQEILQKQFPAVFLYAPTYTYAGSSRVKGSEVSRILTPSDRFNNIEKWYIKTKQVWKR